LATALDPKQIVLNDELLLSQVISQEAVIRLLVEKGIFTKEEFWEMVRAINQEMKRNKGLLFITKKSSNYGKKGTISMPLAFSANGYQRACC